MKTIAYTIFLSTLVAIIIAVAVFFDGANGTQKAETISARYAGNHAFFEALLSQAIQNLKQPTSLLILQILVILLVSRVTAYAFSFIGQPAVMGETIGGILLGPSLLGLVAPSLSHFLFPADSLGRLQSLSQLGLVVYMFIVGMEMDFTQMKARAKESLLIGQSGIVFPFFLGICLSIYLYKEFCPIGVSFLPFALFVGVAMSITAFPGLARIVKEKGLSGTMVGTISITSAAVEDVTAWSLLALIIAVAKSTSIITSVLSLLLVILFIAIMFLIVRPLLNKYQGLLFSSTRSDIFGITLIIALLLVSSVTTDVLGVHTVFGAFIAGLIMPGKIKVNSPVKMKLEDFTSVLLLPVFFALTGLKTQFGLLNSFYLWKLFGLILLVAVAGKFIGVISAARVSKIRWRDSVVLGVLMNTRGLMELIALNIGYDLGVISGPVFTLLVLMAIITTFMTGPLLTLVLKKDNPQST